MLWLIPIETLLFLEILVKKDLIISNLSKITTNILFFPVPHVGAAIWIKKCKWMQSNFCAGIGWLPPVSAFPLFLRLLMDLKPWRTRRGFYPFYPWVYSTAQLTLQSTYLICDDHPVWKQSTSSHTSPNVYSPSSFAVQVVRILFAITRQVTSQKQANPRFHSIHWSFH